MTEPSGSPATDVYGIVPSEATATPSGPGVEGGKLRTVACGPVAAIVSSVSTHPVGARPGNLRAHSDVLQEAIQGSTPLPMRFGFVMDDDDAVRLQLLEARRPELESLLEEMSGRVEMSVKVYFLEDALLRSIVKENRAIAELREATRRLPGHAGYYKRIELGELILEAIERRRRNDASRIHARLDQVAIESVSESDVPDRMVLKAALLVERQRIPALRECVAKLAEERADSMQFTCVGPLPPYSFVEFAPRAQAVAA